MLSVNYFDSLFNFGDFSSLLVPQVSTKYYFVPLAFPAKSMKLHWPISISVLCMGSHSHTHTRWTGEGGDAG